MSNKKALLMILDGWGLGKGGNADEISQVSTPNMDRLAREGMLSILPKTFSISALETPSPGRYMLISLM